MPIAHRRTGPTPLGEPLVIPSHANLAERTRLIAEAERELGIRSAELDAREARLRAAEQDPAEEDDDEYEDDPDNPGQKRKKKRSDDDDKDDQQEARRLQAQRIVNAGRKARGEPPLPLTEFRPRSARLPPPHEPPAADQRSRDVALAIINAGRKARGEPPLKELP